MMLPSLKAPGPVAEAFVASDAPIAVLMGPEGSGKTTSGILRGVVRSYAWPRTAPGVTRVKFALIRRLLKDLEKTTMESWQRWFPRAAGTWRGGKGEPATHEIVLPHPKGGIVEMRTEFIALGDLRVEEALRGWEGSFAYVDEVDLAPPDVLRWVRGRCGRYPPQTLDRNPKCAWGTCNAPEAGSWIIEDFIDDPKAGHVLFRQPSGLSDAAENVAVLGRDWYLAQALTMSAFERRRRIENIPGLAKGAEAVWPEFNPDLHVAAAPLSPHPGRPVIIGADAGGSPAAGFWQQTPEGQWRKLAELTTHAREHNSVTGPTRFGEAVARILAEKFRGLPVHGLADPSAAYGADRANGEEDWIAIVSRVSGVRFRPAPTNSPSVRLEAVRLPMTRMIDGRAPGLLICPTCRHTLQAYSRDYQWQVTAGRRGERPLKNWASHLADADQYALLDGGAYHEVMGRTRADAQRLAPMRIETGFNPFL